MTTPVEVAPTLVRAFESERVGRERTNQLVLQSGGGDDHDNDDGRGYCKQGISSTECHHHDSCLTCVMLVSRRPAK